jgi:hypothetical protein
MISRKGTQHPEMGAQISVLFRVIKIYDEMRIISGDASEWFLNSPRLFS